MAPPELLWETGAMSTALLGVLLAGLVGEDCNRNGRDDALDVLPGDIRFSDPLPPALKLPSPQRDVAIVDLHGDGRLDMVFMDEDGITVAVFDGSAELVAGQRLRVGSAPHAIIAADLDGDGDPDVLTANGLANPQPGNVSVFRNDGGTLDQPRNYAGSRFPAFLAAGDLDGDADLDVVTVGATLDGVSDGVAVLRNDGAGRFDLDDRYDAGNQQPSGDPALADIDGDGALDVAIAKPNRRDSILVFFGDGRGRLDRMLGLELIPGLSPAEVLPVDAEKDGDIDILGGAWAIGGEGGAVTILRNDGGGAFAPAVRLADVAGSRDAVLADLDGDGWADLALAHTFTPGASVLRGGEGGFAPPRTYVLPGIAETIEAADWDRDGGPDLLALNLFAGSAFLVESENIAAAAPSRSRLAVEQPSDPLFLDFDGDGDQDLALSTEEPDTLRVFRNDSGGLEPLELSTLSLSGEIDSMLSADLDGDGRMDIAGTSGSGLELFFGSGDGLFEPLLLPSAGGLGNAFFRDMDGDRDLDVFASSWSDEGAFALLRNGGGRSFDPPAYLVSRLEGDFQLLRPAPGDFDGDGDTDVLVGRSVSPVAGAPPDLELGLLVNPGDGALEFRKLADLEQRPFVVAAGDLDGDGRTDALLGVSACDECPERLPARVLVFLGTSEGLREVERHPVEGVPALLELRDMDGDRDQDAILFSFNAAPSFQVLRNDGSGRFTIETIPGIGAQFVSLIAEDLDGDGDVDVAAAGRSQTPPSCRCALFQVDVFRNQGGGTFDEPRSFVTLSFSWVAHAAPLGPGPPHLLLVDDEGVTILGNLTEAPASRDADRDGIPDECQRRFHRGDPSGDGAADLTDAMVILLHLFLGGAEPGCLDAADANDDGALDITDPIGILEWLFLGGPRPPPPGPPGEPCGPDPAGSTLGCEAIPGCGA